MIKFYLVPTDPFFLKMTKRFRNGVDVFQNNLMPYNPMFQESLIWTPQEMYRVFWFFLRRPLLSRF